MPKKPSGKSPGRLVIQASIWVLPGDERIRIAVSSPGPKFISTVAIEPNSERHHRHLYGKLRLLLKEQGKWLLHKAAKQPRKPTRRPKGYLPKTTWIFQAKPGRIGVHSIEVQLRMSWREDIVGGISAGLGSKHMLAALRALIQ